MVQNDMPNALIGEYLNGYAEKIFYFCLKKTGNAHEAEDLSSEISLCVVAELSRGVVPEMFSAWVWRIARNRYARWAKAKRKYAENIDGSDIDELDIADESDGVLENMIQNEQLNALRRELAFISSDYRNVVVEYYIKNKSVSDIAASLSLPEGTVKSKLFRARKILKEGMDMAREFGKMSYAPENISFINNGICGKDGEPWKYISRLLCKNILLAAYRNPSTAEELSIEVGVALPYMEAELRELVNATLMKKNGDKYETNFFIVSAEAQEKIYAHLAGITPELTKAVIAALEYKVKCLNENCPDWNGGYQPYDKMKWALLMDEADNIRWLMIKPFCKDDSDLTKIGPWGHTVRPNGGEWDILGMESCREHRPNFVGLYGCVSSPEEKNLPEIGFRQFHFQYRGISKNIHGITYADGAGIVSVVKGRSAEVDNEILSRLTSYGYIKKTDDGYIPNILVMRKESADKMTKEEKAEYDALCKKAVEISKRHYLFCRELIYKEIPEFLRDDVFQIEHACGNIFDIRGAVLEEALRTGYISYDENADNRGLGAYLRI